MATKLTIPTKYEGSTLSAPEFNAVVTAINENADSLQETFAQLQDKLGKTTIVINSETSFTIDSIQTLIEYLNQYGTSTPSYNTAPIIKINKTTYVYKAGEALSFDIDLFDTEGGFLTLVGTNPTVSSGYNSFTIEGLRSGLNTIDFNQLVYNNTTSRMDVGTYIFSDIFVIDKLGRSSLTPLNLKIIIGTIELTSGFNSLVSYEKNQAIGVRYGVASITNSLKMTYTVSGKMLVDDGNGGLQYQSFTQVITRNDEFKVTDNEDDFVTGDVYYHTFNIEPFINVGDYTLSILAEGLGDGLGVQSNLLQVNIVVNEAGILYSSSSFNSNGSYYAGDAIQIPVNIFYTETPEIDYIYQCNAWVDGLNITGQSNLVFEQKNITINMTLPDDPDLYTIKYQSVIINPEGEVYKTNINYIALQAKAKSIYNVLTDSYSHIELYLTAKGKSNNSPNWQVWENRYNLSQDYFGTLTEFSPTVNGWEDPSNTNQHIGNSLYASGSSYCMINYYPFDNFDAKGTGLTLDFSIRHGDLIADSAYNLSIGKPVNYPKTGVYVRNNKLEIWGLNSNISVPIICDSKVLTKLGEWETGDEYAHITITYDIIKKEVFVYLNGIISSYGTFSNAENLTHSYPIIFNGALDSNNNITGIADSKLRFFRVYRTTLTSEQVLGNYIASYPDDSERLLLEALNDSVNPVLSIAYMKGDRVGIIKDEMRRLFFNFVPGNEALITNTYIPNPIAVGEYGQQYMDMKEEFPTDVDLQGNSSLSYPIKNYGIDIYDAEAWNNFRVSDGKEYNMVYNKDVLPEYRPWANWDSYHLKANYIDSSHCNNLIMAKLSEQVFRLPYNWSDLGEYFPTSTPFKNFTVTTPKGVIDPYSRFPVYPTRVAVDGFPFVMKGDYTDTNGRAFTKSFIGVYTWNMKQHRKLYTMPSASESPNKRHFIYRCESNGDTVHEELRSGYCKFIDLSKQELLLDSYGRVLTRSYIHTQDQNSLFEQYIPSDYSWYLLDSPTGYLQQNGLYTWIKYALNDTGLELSDNHLSKTHIGIAIDQSTEVKSTDYHDYDWKIIDAHEGIININNLYTIIQFASDELGNNISDSSNSKSHIGFVYDAMVIPMEEGVDYFDKTDDQTEAFWRKGAELIMDWECREPSDMGSGHWEEQINGVWTLTYNIIDPKDLDKSSILPDKILRFIWDNKTTAGDAKRTGNVKTNYWTSIVDSNTLIPTLSDPNQTFAAIDKSKAIEATKQHVDFLNAISWMAESSDECFADSLIFEKYFDLRNCLDYVLCCLTFCLTDSIGRNLTMIAWDQDSVKVGDGIMDRKKMRFYPVFYDIDTAFGTNVQGGLYSTPYIAWAYDIGDIYVAEQGAGQEYNCFGTNFLKRISKNYGPQLMRRYQELRSGTVDPLDSKTKIAAPFDYLNILQLYTKQMVGRVGERYFNQDAVFKYIGFENDPEYTAKRNYITNARGNKVMFMKNFLKKRLDYIDSLLGYIPDTEDMAYFQHYSSGAMTLSFETMTAGYIRISFAQNQVISIYCNGIVPTEVTYNYASVTQHILRIYNCAIITKLTGLTNKDVRIARLNSMVNLRVLDLKGNPNFGSEVSTLEIASCRNLRTIDLTGCNGSNEFTPDISGCVLLEQFLISNSSVGNVSFSQNLNLVTIDVRGCTRFNSLDVSNLYRLTQLYYDEWRLVSLNISNSAIIVDFSLDNTYNNLTSLKIINNRAITALQFGTNSFNSLEQLEIANCSKLVSVIDLFKNRTGYPSLNVDFLGTCPLLVTVENLFENSVLTQIPSRMLQNSSKVKSLKGCFKDCKQLESIPTGIFDSIPYLEDITDIFNGARLQYYTDIEGIDEYGFPVITGKQIHNVIKTDNLFAQCPSLKTVTRAFANSELVNVPVNIFNASLYVTNIDQCFYNITNEGSLYNGVKQPLTLPTTLWNNLRIVNSAVEVFKNSYMTTVPNDLFSTANSLTTIQGLFSGCPLTNLPANMFSLGANVLTDISNAFQGTQVSTLPINFLKTLPALTNINNLFLNSNITSLNTGFLVSNAITSFKFSDLGIPNLTIINADILSSNTVLTNISNLYSNTQIHNSPDYLFSTNRNISNISNLVADSVINSIGENFLVTNSVTDITGLFQNRSTALSIGSGFMEYSPNLLLADYAFDGCTGISVVNTNMLNVCESLTSATYLFNNCTNLITINAGLLEDVAVLTGISNIFKNTAISSIPDRCLVNPNITTFKFSDILTHKVSISNDFLSESSLTNIDNLFTNTLIEDIPTDFFSTHTIANPTNLFLNSGIKTIGDNALSGITLTNCSSLFASCPIVSIGNNFMINSAVTNISNIFKNRTTLVSVGTNFLGAKTAVTNAESAFDGCINWVNGSDVFLNDSANLTNIKNIFKGCTKLLALPTGFITNSKLVNSLEGVFLDNGITIVPNDFCINNTGITTLISPTTSLSIFDDSAVVNIGNNAFRNCINLTRVTIPSYITTLGTNVFNGCTGLTNATFNAILSIPEGTFNGCNHLTNVNITAVTGTIGIDSFRGCTLLSAVTIPTTVTTIGNTAFYGCSTLTTITLPASITTLGNNIFENCTLLSVVRINAISVPTVGTTILLNTALTKIYVPYTLVNSYIAVYNWSIYQTYFDGVYIFIDNAFKSGLISSGKDLNNDGEFSIAELATITSLPNSTSYTNITTLEDLVMLPNLTIIGVCFANCLNLTSITIPSTVTTISNGAFAGCNNVTEFIVNAGNTSFKTVDGVLYTYDETQLVAYPNGKTSTSYTVPVTVTLIRNYAFKGDNKFTIINVVTETPATATVNSFESVNKTTCRIIALTSSDVTTYKAATGWSLFTNIEVLIVNVNLHVPTAGTIASVVTAAGYVKDQITSLTLTGNLNGTDIKYIREMVGKNTTGVDTTGSLIILDMSGANIVSGGDYYYYSSDSSTYYYTANDVFGSVFFYNCTKLTSIIIPNSITSIGSSAFSGCTTLVSVTLDNNITSIGSHAFRNCEILNSIVIPDSVTSLGIYTFSSCSALPYINIQNVTSIGEGVFQYCYNLTSITLSNSLISIGMSAFYFSGLTSITIPSSVTSIGNAAFQACTKLTSVNFPNGTCSIGYQAFRDCPALVDLVLPYCTSIQENTLTNCGVINLTIGGGLSSVTQGTFEYLLRLTTLNYNALAGYITYCFRGCTALTTVNTGTNVGKIGGGAFSGCPIVNIEFPSSITQVNTGISGATFDGCTNLQTITFNGTSVPTLYQPAFTKNCPSLVSVRVPSSAYSAYNTATNWKNYGSTSTVTATKNKLVGF